MGPDDDIRLQIARRALEQELGKTERPTHVNWHEAIRPSDATVIALEVTQSDARSQREDLLGSAINDGRTLLLSVRVGDNWTIRRINADDFEMPTDDDQQH